MKLSTWLLDKGAGCDAKMRRLVGYWSATALLYAVALVFMWVEVHFGKANSSIAILFTALVVVGEVAFFWLIRNYQRLGLTAAQLSLYQSWFAIVCVGFSYTGQGALRGATLVGLFVVLIFSAFSLKAREARALSMFAIAFLGATMISMPYTAPQFFDLKTELLHFMLGSSALAVVGVITGRLNALQESLKAQREELRAAAANRTLATTDELTSLPNRRYMTELLRRNEHHRTGSVTSACIALIDLDWFKKINDGYGHDAGDEVLKRFAQIGRQQLRECDVLARWGGEEFLLFLPESDLDSAHGVLERLRQRVQTTGLSRHAVQIPFTFSAGLVELVTDEPVEHGIRRADALLYRAKEKGRNLIVTAAAD